MGFMEFISTYLLDITISIVVLSILIGSFFKPTQRYARWLTGLTVAILLVGLIKNIPFFNFVEYYIQQLFITINFESLVQLIYTLLGRPEGFRVTVRGLKPSIGAGFIVALSGSIMTMPGLPKVPAANNMDVIDGKTVGLF